MIQDDSKELSFIMTFELKQLMFLLIARSLV